MAGAGWERVKQVFQAVAIGLAVLPSVTASFPVARAAADEGRWVASWVAAQQLTEPHNMPPAPGLGGQTLRQVIQPSLGGRRLRVTLSNAFGDGDLTVDSVHVAKSAGLAAIDPASDRALTFAGASSVTIPRGAVMVSDPMPFDVVAHANLAVSLHLVSVPAALTGHPGSRTTSFLQAGDVSSTADLRTPATADHWYVLSGLDVWADPRAAAIVVLGDSITDGRGSTTNKNDRWPNLLSRRLRANPATAEVAVLNGGMGGNRLLRDGIGPNALARFERDVLAVPGVKWLVVLEGVNDIGTAVDARKRGEPAATAADVIAAYRQMIVRAHSHGLRVYVATILPFEGFAAYSSPQSEADRQEVNRWIRAGGDLDGVIDFDAVARDPALPSRLRETVDGGDHLHPSAAGYRILAEAIDLSLFAR
jgi:lysophospholipase L1-like esterase